MITERNSVPVGRSVWKQFTPNGTKTTQQKLALFWIDMHHRPEHHLQTVLRLRADHSSYSDSIPFLHELDLYHSHTAFTKLFQCFQHYLQGYIQSNTHTAQQIRLRHSKQHTHWNLIRRKKNTLASTHTYMQWNVLASHKRQQDTSRHTKRTQAHAKKKQQHVFTLRNVFYVFLALINH